MASSLKTTGGVIWALRTLVRDRDGVKRPSESSWGRNLGLTARLRRAPESEGNVINSYAFNALNYILIYHIIIMGHIPCSKFYD